MNPIRKILGLKKAPAALRKMRSSARAERWQRRIAGFYRNEQSGTDGSVWEPLVLFSFLLAAAFVGPASQVPAIFAVGSAERDDPAMAIADPVPAGISASAPPPGAMLLDMAPASPATSEGDADESPPPIPNGELEPDAGAGSPTSGQLERPALVVPPNADRALISWWNDERWEERDADGEQWKREWLRFARRNPDDVPLELWLSVLEWAPNDRALLRSASRAASRHSPRRRRGGWLAAGPDDRAHASETARVVAEIERAVRDSQRRADFSEHRDDGPSSSWYRSLLRRLRGGG